MVDLFQEIGKRSFGARPPGRTYFVQRRYLILIGRAQFLLLRVEFHPLIDAFNNKPAMAIRQLIQRRQRGEQFSAILGDIGRRAVPATSQNRHTGTQTGNIFLCPRQCPRQAGHKAAQRRSRKPGLCGHKRPPAGNR